jgi:hypothetical protein
MDSSVNFYSILKSQLLKITNDFIREIDISFDYINKDILTKIKKNISISETNDIKFKELYMDIYNTIEKYKSFIYLNEKVKTSQLVFLNDVILFDLSFSLFNDESKNTKKTIVNYLKELFIISNFLRCIETLNDSDDNSLLYNEIKEMVDKINPVMETQSTDQIIKTDTIKPKNANVNLLNELMKEMGSGVSGNGINNLLESLPVDDIMGSISGIMQNKDIMNIANELTNEIEMSNIDPMSIMSSLLSGNTNDNQISSLISNISNKITNKINNGQIDKNMLENEANKFMESLSSNSELLSFADKFNQIKK